MRRSWRSTITFGAGEAARCSERSGTGHLAPSLRFEQPSLGRLDSFKRIPVRPPRRVRSLACGPRRGSDPEVSLDRSGRQVRERLLHVRLAPLSGRVVIDRRVDVVTIHYDSSSIRRLMSMAFVWT